MRENGGKLTGTWLSLGAGLGRQTIPYLNWLMGNSSL